jgi:histidyl-tRNA synthetase
MGGEGMDFQSVKGTRDFYPDAMRLRTWIADAWRRVSLRNGFEEYDAPIFEYLDLFTIKSGEEIAEQLFSFTDRGGRNLAIRPEITPSLARMVNAKINSLPRPIKWFSIPRLCRAEKPQRGRLREFFQWNIDIIGEDDCLADAECIFVMADFCREVGLTTEHFVIKISSRALLASILEQHGIATTQADAVYAVLDKRDKVNRDTFATLVDDLGVSTSQRELLLALGEASGPEGLERVRALLGDHAAGSEQLQQFDRLFELLDLFGVGDCCRFDMGVVRGLTYYTGVVFEAFGKGELQRAICGGGRYDRLLAELGGPPMSGVGFATSDVVIEDVLREFNLLPTPQTVTDVFVIDAEPQYFERALSIATSLRAQNVATTYSYKRQGVGKQLKQAAARGARRVVIVDADAIKDESVKLKDMETGVQQTVTVASLVADPFQVLRQ